MITVVLGAGPVGLLSAFVLRAEVCVGEVPGGVPLQCFAPAYLWRTPTTERLLRDLDLPRVPAVRRFAYLTTRGIVCVPTPADREDYFRRSRGIPADVAVEVPKSVASSGVPGMLPVWHLSLDTLIARLLHEVRVECARVSALCPEGDQLEVVCYREGHAFLLPADRVINTLPAPVWDEICPTVPRVWLAGNKEFVLGRLLPDLEPLVRDLDYVYVTDPALPFDRVFLRDPEEVVYEFSRRVSAEFLTSVSGRVAYWGPLQVRGTTRAPEALDGRVRHVGRFARWDHSIRLHDVAAEMYALREADTLEVGLAVY